MSFYKVLVIGEVGVGKTSMTNRIVFNTFSEKYKATIGCEFGLKIIEINDQPVRIQLWDLAGQDRLGGISRLYCRDANGAIVVSDITKKETLQKATLWKGNVDDTVRLADNIPIPMVLCANKYDLVNPDQVMSEAEFQQFAQQGRFVSGFYTSAKDGTNTETALEVLIKEIQKLTPQARADSMESAIARNSAQRLQVHRQNFSGSWKKKKCC